MGLVLPNDRNLALAQYFYQGAIPNFSEGRANMSIVFIEQAALAPLRKYDAMAGWVCVWDKPEQVGKKIQYGRLRPFSPTCSGSGRNCVCV